MFMILASLFFHIQLLHTGFSNFLDPNPINDSPIDDIYHTKCKYNVEKCQNLTNTCFDLKLPYEFQYKPFYNVDIRMNNISYFSPFKIMPRCWDKLKIFLCAYHYQECSSNEAVLPDSDLCKDLHDSCPLSQGNLIEFLPSFFNCSNYNSNCRINKLRQAFFQSSNSECIYPLTKTLRSEAWVPGFYTCAFNCQPVYLDSTKVDTAIYIQIFLAFIILSLNITFICFQSRITNNFIIWTSLGLISWLISLFMNAPCNQDNTYRRSEPKLESKNSFYCLVTFFLFYTSTLATIFYLTFLLISIAIVSRYLTNILKQVVENEKIPVDLNENSLSKLLFSSDFTKKLLIQFKNFKKYAKIIMFTASVLLSIMVFLMSSVDAEPLSKICFVSSSQLSYRVVFVWLPMFLCLITQNSAILLTLKFISQLKATIKSHSHIHLFILLNPYFSCYSILYLLIVNLFTLHSFVFDIFWRVNEPVWLEQQRLFLLCSLKKQLYGFTLQDSHIECRKNQSAAYFPLSHDIYTVPDDFSLVQPYFVPILWHSLAYFIWCSILLSFQTPLSLKIFGRCLMERFFYAKKFFPKTLIIKDESKFIFNWWDPGFLAFFRNLEDFNEAKDKIVIEFTEINNGFNKDKQLLSSDASTDDSSDFYHRERFHRAREFGFRRNVRENRNLASSFTSLPAKKTSNRISSIFSVKENSDLDSQLFLNIPVTKPSSVDASSFQIRFSSPRFDHNRISHHGLYSGGSQISMQSAHSYNSYQLLTGITGAEAKEKWRTRHNLRQVLDWAHQRASLEVGKPEKLNFSTKTSLSMTNIKQFYPDVDANLLKTLAEELLLETDLSTLDDSGFIVQAAYQAAYVTLSSVRAKDFSKKSNNKQLEFPLKSSTTDIDNKSNHSDDFNSEDEKMSCSSAEEESSTAGLKQ